MSGLVTRTGHGDVVRTHYLVAFFFADECNGYRLELCRELIAGRISLPATDDDRKVQRAESNKEKKRKAMAARRQKEKEAKQAAEDNN